MGCVVGRSVPEESEQCGEPRQPPTHEAEEQGLVPLSVTFPTCPLLIATRKPQSSDVCYPKRRVRAGDPGVLLACPCCSSSSAYALRGNILVPLCMAACSPHIVCLRWAAGRWKSPLSFDRQWVRLIRSLADKMDGCWPWTWQRHWGFPGEDAEEQAGYSSLCLQLSNPCSPTCLYHKRGCCKWHKYERQVWQGLSEDAHNNWKILFWVLQSREITVIRVEW